MFDYESLYNIKMFGKTFHILEDRNTCSNMRPVPKVKGAPPPPLLGLLDFKKANILHNYFIYLYSRICILNRY